MAPSPLTRSLWLLGFSARIAYSQSCTQCDSYGLDYVDGGSYFQNSASTANFTAYEDFVGCQNDLASNILVDPNGMQYTCNRVPTQPDSTTQLVTCPLQQDQMFSGNWSIIVLSNNGACDPIDNIRQFSLSVGAQSTTVVPPTITLSSTTTPVLAITSTTTRSVTATANATTTTVPSAAAATVTVYPLISIKLVTRGVLTQTKTSQVASVVATSTTTTTASCGFHGRRLRIADPTNTYVSVTAKAARKTRVEPTGRFALDASQRKRDIGKRHPDPPTTTVTATSLSTVTVTNTITAPTTTVTGTSTVLKVTTTTPTVTVSSGTRGIATVTAPRQTITDTLLVPVETDTVTSTVPVTVTKTATVTPKCTA